MLDTQKRKNLAALAEKKMTTEALSTKGQKLKAMAEATPSEDEETCYGLVFKRKRTDAASNFVHSVSNSRALLYRDFPPNPSLPRDIAVQEGRGESASEEGVHHHSFIQTDSGSPSGARLTMKCSLNNVEN